VRPARSFKPEKEERFKFVELGAGDFAQKSLSSNLTGSASGITQNVKKKFKKVKSLFI